MPWDLLPVEQSRWYKKPLIWAGVAAVLCVLLLVLPKVQKRYQRWSERRGVQRAVEAYLRGDFKQAVVDARGVLKKNPQSGDATRIVAQSLEALKSPQALAWRQELDSLQGGDAENLLGLAAASIKSGDFDGATRALARVKPDDHQTATFHEISARLARRNRDLVAAEKHWREAVQLAPEKIEYQVGLAATQLESRVPETRAAALAALEKLTETPDQRIAALRTLLADSLARRENSRTRQIAARLAADPAAQFTDKVARLAVLRTTRDPKSAAYLAELQELAAADPAQVHQLISWMNENNLALAVIEWEARLPAELTGKPPICAALADAYARAADWKGLKAKIEHAAWAEMEFLRLAFLSRTLERLDDVTAGNAAWNNALATAQTRPEWLETLGRVTKAWGWKQRAEDTLWKLTATERRPRWAIDFLWSAASARGDTPRLYEASKLLVKADPGNLAARNNHAALALLLGETADGPQELAETLYKQNPDKVIVASTHGFALFQQGRAADAVAIMEKFPVAELRVPPSAIYYAIFLAGAGQAERADEYFRLAANAPLLPEETALVAFLAPACRARTLERSGDTRGADAAWQEAIAAAKDRPERLERLAQMALAWSWPTQAEALALKMAAIEHCPPWAAETLWRAAAKTTDAAQIHRAGRLILKVDPNNLGIRNRFLAVALLTGREAEAAQIEIRGLAREHPGNIDVVATCALSLYQQGRVEEAVALLGPFPAEQLRAPSVALYHGLFLAGVGRVDEAKPFLQLAANAPLLAEEKALLASAGNPPRPSAVARTAATPTPAPAVPAARPLDRTRTDTRLLYKEAREAFLADSKNITARSNYILLALLTGQNTDSARQLARALHKDHPADSGAAACFGLSLFQQGKVDEAIAILETLPPAQLREPVIAHYYGVFLASSGRPEKVSRAPEFLAAAAKTTLLPEEKAFLTTAKSTP